ncbi:MAG: hypothetical protein RMY36_009645, partial [Nostoc sp. SerVER01]
MYVNFSTSIYVAGVSDTGCQQPFARRSLKQKPYSLRQTRKSQGRKPYREDGKPYSLRQTRKSQGRKPYREDGKPYSLRQTRKSQG